LVAAGPLSFSVNYLFPGKEFLLSPTIKNTFGIALMRTVFLNMPIA